MLGREEKERVFGDCRAKDIEESGDGSDSGQSTGPWRSSSLDCHRAQQDIDDQAQQLGGQPRMLMR